MQQSNLDVSKEKLIFDMKKYVQNVIRNSQFFVSIYHRVDNETLIMIT